MKLRYLSGVGLLIKGVSFLYPPVALLGWMLWLLGIRPNARALRLSVYSACLVLAGNLLLISGIARLDPDTFLSEENIFFFLGAYLVSQAGGVVFAFALKALGFRLSTAWLLAVLLFPLGLPVLYGLRLWLAYLFFRGFPLKEEPAQANPSQGEVEVGVKVP